MDDLGFALYTWWADSKESLRVRVSKKGREKQKVRQKEDKRCLYMCSMCVFVNGDICRDLHASTGPHPGADRCVFNVTTDRGEGYINLSLGEREKSIHRAQGHGVAVLMFYIF